MNDEIPKATESYKLQIVNFDPNNSGVISGMIGTEDSQFSIVFSGLFELYRVLEHFHCKSALRHQHSDTSQFTGG
jgi:hypothetical protein